MVTPQQLLLPYCDPCVDDSFALQWALLGNKTDCIDLLFDGSNPVDALAVLNTIHPKRGPEWLMYEARAQIIQQRKLLENVTHEVNNSGIANTPRKM